MSELLVKLPAADLDGDLYVQDYRARRMCEITPARPAWGEGRYMPKTPCLLAPADDRNALATTAGGIVLAVCICTLKPILAATPARSISLPRPATVNGAPPGNEDEGRLGARFSTRSARNSSPSSRKVTPCHDLRAGELRLDGTLRQFPNPAAAAAAGIVCIFQELSLLPDLSVADNISISSPPKRFGMIDARAQRRRADALLAEVGCEDVNPLLRVRDLPLSRRAAARNRWRRIATACSRPRAL